MNVVYMRIPVGKEERNCGKGNWHVEQNSQLLFSSIGTLVVTRGRSVAVNVST